MVLDHVADGAGLLVVGRAAFDAEGLGDGDLDVVDVLAVPDRLEYAVGEPEREDVLHRLLAEVMVDAIDLFLGRRPASLARAPRRVPAERLLDDDARPAPSSGVAEPRRPSAIALGGIAR